MDENGDGWITREGGVETGTPEPEGESMRERHGSINKVESFVKQRQIF